LLTNSLQKLLGGFVGLVLRDEATLERPFQDALSQSGGTLQVGVHLGFDFIEDGELLLNLFDDLGLLTDRRKRDADQSQDRTVDP